MQRLEVSGAVRTIYGSLGVKRLNCTLVEALRLCAGRTAHRAIRGIALLFLDHGTRRGWGFNVTLRPLFTPGKDPVPIVQEAGWATGPVWTGAENLAPRRDSIPGPSSPVAQSLYRLSYPAHYEMNAWGKWFAFHLNSCSAGLLCYQPATL